jgi:hypothetical protein
LACECCVRLCVACMRIFPSIYFPRVFVLSILFDTCVNLARLCRCVAIVICFVFFAPAMRTDISVYSSVSIHCVFADILGATQIYVSTYAFYADFHSFLYSLYANICLATEYFLEIDSMFRKSLTNFSIQSQ